MAEKMHAPEQAARDAEIVGLRLRGVSAGQIAETYNISARRVGQIMDAWRKTNPPLRVKDPLEIVDELLEQYGGASEELAMISASSNNGPTRVGAIKARMEVLKQTTELLQAIGVLPKDLGKLRVELDIRFVAETIMRVMDEENVPVEIQEKLVAALERGRQAEAAAVSAGAAPMN